MGKFIWGVIDRICNYFGEGKEVGYTRREIDLERDNNKSILDRLVLTNDEVIKMEEELTIIKYGGKTWIGAGHDWWRRGEDGERREKVGKLTLCKTLYRLALQKDKSKTSHLS